MDKITQFTDNIIETMLDDSPNSTLNKAIENFIAYFENNVIDKVIENLKEETKDTTINSEKLDIELKPIKHVSFEEPFSNKQLKVMLEEGLDIDNDPYGSFYRLVYKNYDLNFIQSILRSKISDFHYRIVENLSLPISFFPLYHSFTETEKQVLSMYKINSNYPSKLDITFAILGMSNNGINFEVLKECYIKLEGRYIDHNINKINSKSIIEKYFENDTDTENSDYDINNVIWSSKQYDEQNDLIKFEKPIPDLKLQIPWNPFPRENLEEKNELFDLDRFLHSFQFKDVLREILDRKTKKDTFKNIVDFDLENFDTLEWSNTFRQTIESLKKKRPLIEEIINNVYYGTLLEKNFHKLNFQAVTNEIVKFKHKKLFRSIVEKIKNNHKKKEQDRERENERRKYTAALDDMAKINFTLTNLEIPFEKSNLKKINEEVTLQDIYEKHKIADILEYALTEELEQEIDLKNNFKSIYTDLINTKEDDLIFPGTEADLQQIKDFDSNSFNWKDISSDFEEI